MKHVLNILVGLGCSLASANSAVATSISLPYCLDQTSGSEVYLYSDFQNGQRLLGANDAKEIMAVILADCSNGFALQVRDQKNWFYGPVVPGETLYDRLGQVREYLEGAVTSQETYSWGELRKKLSGDGYLVEMGKFSPENCGCGLNW